MANTACSKIFNARLKMNEINTFFCSQLDFICDVVSSAIHIVSKLNGNMNLQAFFVYIY